MAFRDFVAQAGVKGGLPDTQRRTRSHSDRWPPKVSAPQLASGWRPMANANVVREFAPRRNRHAEGIRISVKKVVERICF
jgi:hypothetical protein